VYGPAAQLVYTSVKIVITGQTILFEGGKTFHISYRIISLSEGDKSLEKHRLLNINNDV
jgi:hypothetical protein